MISTVFIIIMENHSWDLIKGSPKAPYVNKLITTIAAHAENYQNILHPSEPNYLYLEGGTDYGVINDGPPSANHQATKDHLATYLESAGRTWTSWQEDISGTVCPLNNVAQYATKHNPFVYFDDITDGLKATSAHCIAHNRPYSEFAAALTSGRASSYNFITPNLCNDTHDCGIDVGDAWLAAEVPKILASAQYKAGGLLILLWDETGGGGLTNDIPCVVLSPYAKPAYSSPTKYTHASTVRTVEEIFSLSPMLGGAKTAVSLGDMLTAYP